ncbi:MAG: recombinase family protein, partial [Proteobacteria bacterium]|nr:recombinase family protein [Pseudomonadota bacterium]
MIRTAIYARYSSDNQRDASIEDQLRLCKRQIKSEGWSLVDVYTDAAISGATTLRPGYQKLLEDVRSGKLDIVVAEALDRLSRDQEDIAALYKQLSFSGVKLITLAEGEINELHIGFKGTMNAIFLKDLAQKTHRGLEGRVRQGFSGGGIAYGYDVVRETDANGEPVRGKRRINEAEAVIVRRIFEEFAQGRSPRGIAKSLNAEGVAGPKGRPWQDTTIRGHATRRTGILRNDL